MWLIRAFRGAACDLVWEKGAKLHTFAFRALSEWIGSAYQAKLSWRGWAGSLSAPAFYLDVGARQVPGKYRLASNSILAGILLSRGWSPGANYSLLCCPEGHLVRSIVLREGKRGWQATSRRLIDFKKRDTESREDFVGAYGHGFRKSFKRGPWVIYPSIKWEILDAKAKELVELKSD